MSSDLSADTTTPTRVAVVVCLCASRLPEAFLRAAGGGPLVVFAPDDQFDRFTRAHPAGGAKIRHVAALPGPRSGKDEALMFNMPGLASFAEPAPALSALLPGLKVTSRAAVRRLGPPDLKAVLWPASPEMVLFIDAPGAEVEILDALDAAGVLQQLSQLVVRCGQERFFTGGASRSDIAARLSGRMFAETSVDESDPDWPVVSFGIDEKQRQIAALTAHVARLEAAEATWRRDTDELRAALAQQQAVAAEALRKQEQALSELAFSARVQALLQQDLRALRDRLASSETERLRQESLLRKLTPKLAEAAGYLRQLQQDPVASAALAPPEGPAHKPGKSGARKGAGSGGEKPGRKAKSKAGS